MEISAGSKKSLPLYPVLLVSYAFLHFLSFNIQSPESLDGLLPYYRYAVAGLAVFWLFSWAALKNFYKAAFAAGSAAFIFFSYGHINNLLKPLTIPARHYWFLAFCAWLMFRVFRLCFKKDSAFFIKASVFLNTVAGLAVTVPLITLAAYSLYPPPPSPVVQQRPIDFDKEKLKAGALPDIYYIILDEYARQDMLQKYYDYTNDSFLSELKTLNFFIAPQSNSNYGYTSASLTASLNMNYVHELAPDNETRELLFEEMNKKNRVARFLKKLGYRYILFDSGMFDFTAQSPLADEIVTNNGADELKTVFFNTTILTVLARQLLSEEWRNGHLHRFHTLEQMPARPGPKFVFAHFLLPHPPFVFNAWGGRVDGRKISMNMVRPDLYAADYLGQLIYTNKLVLESIKKILKTSHREPVIIVQSDHGAEWIHRSSEWWATEEAIEERYANFTAVHLPPSVKNGFYDTITPVNIFRVLLRDLFDAKIEPLPDRVFLDCEVDRNQLPACGPSGVGFHDITAQARAQEPPAPAPAAS